MADNTIQIPVADEEATDILHRRLMQRFQEEKGRVLTKQESDGCWWTICGIVMRQGHEAGRQYVDTVALRD